MERPGHESLRVAPELAYAVRDGLARLPILDSMLGSVRPKDYWLRPIEVVASSAPAPYNEPPITAELDRKSGQQKLLINEEKLGDSLDQYATSYPESRERLKIGFAGLALVHDLIFRALPHDRRNEIAEAASSDSDFITILSEKGIINDTVGTEVIKELACGDPDQVIRINIYRFAIGILRQLTPNDEIARALVANIEQSLSQSLTKAHDYRAMTEGWGGISWERGVRMYVEQINELEVAVALPMGDVMLEQLAAIFS